MSIQKLPLAYFNIEIDVGPSHNKIKFKIDDDSTFFKI